MTSHNNFIKLINEDDGEINQDNGDINEDNGETKVTKQEETQEFQECLFCFELVDPAKSFVGCDTCGKMCHDTCYFDWFKRKNDSRCISCQQATLVFSETKTTFVSQCLYSILGKKQKFYKKFYKIG